LAAENKSFAVKNKLFICHNHLFLAVFVRRQKSLKISHRRKQIILVGSLSLKIKVSYFDGFFVKNKNSYSWRQKTAKIIFLLFSVLKNRQKL
jgi:hypothetical protein